MKKYLKLMRIHHYIKNLLILLPLVFSGSLFNTELLKFNLLGFFVFCLTASGIYIINDIADVKRDRLHPIKCKRPIASGEIEKKNAIIFAVILFFVAIGCNSFLYIKSGCYVWILHSIYVFINLAYSFGLKEIPVVDVIILAAGFLIRVLYGGAVTGIEVSAWLYFTVLSVSVYMSLGKRRNELKNQGECVRKVLRYYSYRITNTFMYIFFIFTLCFYTLWCVATVSTSKFSELLYFTIPMVFLIMARYSKNIEGKVDGDPVNVLLKDKMLVAGGVMYVACLFFIMYGKSML